MERLNRHYRRAFSVADLKAEIWRRDYAYRQRAFTVPENYFPIDEARIIIAQDAGFGSWQKPSPALVLSVFAARPAMWRRKAVCVRSSRTRILGESSVGNFQPRISRALRFPLGVQRQLLLVAQPQDRQRRERLRHRCDAEQRFRSDRTFRHDVLHTAALRVHELESLYHG